MEIRPISKFFSRSRQKEYLYKYAEEHSTQLPTANNNGLFKRYFSTGSSLKKINNFHIKVFKYSNITAEYI